MCGLVGIFSSNMFQRHQDCLENLLFFDTLRGQDSTGVAALRGNADTAILKSTVPGYEFIQGPKLNNHLRFSDFCWIGHNRYGTVGKNVKTNAHPFDILDDDGGCMVVGAHNGTLKNKYSLEDHALFGTDSEAMFHNIAHHGLEQTIAKLEGAWAITYYDHLEEELRLLRNKERTLFYAYEDNHKTLIWASEQWMIRVAASRSNIKLEEDRVYVVPEDTLLKFPVPLKINQVLTCERQGGLVGKQAAGFFHGGRWQERSREGTTGGASGATKTHQETTKETQTTRQTQLPGLPLSREEIARLRKEAHERQTSTTSSTQSGTATGSAGEKPDQTKGGSSKEQSKPGEKVVSIDKAKKYKGFGGKLHTKKEIERQLENGCAWCEQEFIVLTDRFGWLAPEKPVCEKCLVGQPDEAESGKTVTLH